VVAEVAAAPAAVGFVEPPERVMLLPLD